MVSFIGSVPADDPQLVILVAIDEVHDEEKQASSSFATTLTSDAEDEKSSGRESGYVSSSSGR